MGVCSRCNGIDHVLADCPFDNNGFNMANPSTQPVQSNILAQALQAGILGINSDGAGKDEGDRMPPNKESKNDSDRKDPASVPVDFFMKFADVMSGISDKVYKKETLDPAVFVPGHGKTIETFLDEYEAFMKEKHGSNDLIWGERLGKYLGEPLKSVYEDMKSTNSGYSCIKEYLLCAYGSHIEQKTITDYILEFQHCSYNPKDGISGLVCRLSSLANKAYEGLDSKVVEDLIKRQCLSLLPLSFRSTLQFQTLAQPTLALSEVVRLGTALEKSLGSAEVVNAESRKEKGAVKKETKSVKQASEKLKDKTPDGSSMNGNNAGSSCTYCKKSGHTRDECYRLNKLCYKCGKKGHFVPECPERSNQRYSSGNGDSVQRNQNIVCGFCSKEGHPMATCVAFKEFMKKTIEEMTSKASN